MRYLISLKPFFTIKASLLISFLFLISSCSVSIYEDAYGTTTRPHLSSAYNFHGRAVDGHNMPVSGLQILANHWDVEFGGEGLWHTIVTDRDGYFSFRVAGGRKGVLVINGVMSGRGSKNYAERGDNLFFNIGVFNFITPARGIGGGPILISKKDTKKLKMNRNEAFDFRVGKTIMGKDYFAIMKMYNKGNLKGAAKAGKRYLKRYSDVDYKGHLGDVRRAVKDFKKNKERRLELKKDSSSAPKSKWNVDERRRSADKQRVEEDKAREKRSSKSGSYGDDSLGIAKGGGSAVNRFVTPVEPQGRFVDSGRSRGVNIAIPSVSSKSASVSKVKVVVPMNDSPKKKSPPKLSKAEERARNLASVGCANVIEQSAYLSAPNLQSGKCVELRANFVKKLSKRSAVFTVGAKHIVISSPHAPLKLKGGFNGIVRSIGKKKLGKKAKGEELEHFNVLISN